MRRVICVLTAALGLVAIGGLADGGETARAASRYQLESSFGTEGLGSGEFMTPFGAAVQRSTGDLFVADEGNHRIQVFDPEGQFLAQLTGTEVTVDGGNFSEATGVAVDNSAGVSGGDIYVADKNHGVVDKFQPNGPNPSEGYTYVCQLTGIGGGCAKEGGTPTAAFSEPSGVAVDGSGNVYVVQLNGPVEEFDAEGSFIAILGSDASFAFGIAVDATGSAVYVANAFNDVVKLTVDPSTHTVESSEVLDEGGSMAVVVNQTTGEAFVDDSQGGSHILVYEADAKHGTRPTKEFGGGQIGELSVGLAYSSQGEGKVYVTDASGADVHIFALVTSVADVECGPPVTIKVRLARLACAVEPGGEEAKFHVDYQEVASQAVLSTQEETLAAPQLAEVTLEGLAPETEYTYQGILVTQTQGVIETSPVKFTTLPAVPGVSGCKANAVSGSQAVLEASLEPDEATDYQFEYGLSKSYGLASATQHSPGTGSERAEATLTGLEPNSTYDCRLSATDAEGTTDGANGSFHTSMVEPAVEEQAPVASSVTSRTALLKGTLNPENSATSFRFIYGTTTSYGESTEEEQAGSGFGPEAVEAPELRGLAPDTIYHFAVIATNGSGTTKGLDHTFVTPPPAVPGVELSKISGVTSTSATVSATIDARGLPAAYVLELGTDTAYDGAKIFGQVGQGEEALIVQLEALAPGTAYHIRLVAVNQEGRGESSDATFTTLATNSPLTQPVVPVLIVTPAITFPTVVGKVIKSPPPKKARKRRKKHGGNSRHQPEHKAGRGKRRTKG